MNYKVRLRNGFSDRNNIKKENITMQITSFDERTRIELCNYIDIVFNVCFDSIYYDDVQLILKAILSNVYLLEVEYNHNYDSDYVLSIIKKTIKNDEYDDVLTVIEYIVNETIDAHKKRYIDSSHIVEGLNNIFEKEYVGYRYVNEQIVPITNDYEIQAIKQATDTNYENVNDFLSKAIEKLSDRKNPDYENSIKESISAVEAMCNHILGQSGTLGASLKKLEDSGVIIHPSLKSSFEKLYGYTSDESGIRHAGRIGGKGSTFAEAKFMLVTCSAFINYLIDNIK